MQTLYHIIAWPDVTCRVTWLVSTSSVKMGDREDGPFFFNKSSKKKLQQQFLTANKHKYQGSLQMQLWLVTLTPFGGNSCKSQSILLKFKKYCWNIKVEMQLPMKQEPNRYGVNCKPQGLSAVFPVFPEIFNDELNNGGLQTHRFDRSLEPWAPPLTHTHTPPPLQSGPSWAACSISFTLTSGKTLLTLIWQRHFFIESTINGWFSGTQHTVQLIFSTAAP